MQLMREDKFVVARLSALGDVVLTTGVLDYWHRTRGWRFQVLTRKSLTSIFDNHPAVDAVIGLSEDDLKFPASLGLFRQLAAKFKGARLIDLHDSLRTRMLAKLWRGKVMRYPKLGVARRLFLFSGHRLCEAALLAHNVPQRYAQAADEPPPPKSELVPRIFLSSDELAEAAQRLQEPVPCMQRLDAPGGKVPLVALHPYATHPQKAWPPEYWQRLIADLEARGITWFVVGQENEPALRLHLPQAAARDFTNLTGLRATCALLAQADLLITADSGPMHLGTAVGTPVLGLFGPTTRHWGFFPSGPQDKVLEADCPDRPFSLHGKTGGKDGDSCMRLIEPGQVLEQAVEMLGNKS